MTTRRPKAPNSETARTAGAEPDPLLATEVVPEPIDDGADPSSSPVAADPAPQPEPEPEPQPVAKPVGDSVRDQIVARARQKRDSDNEPDETNADEDNGTPGEPEAPVATKTQPESTAAVRAEEPAQPAAPTEQPTEFTLVVDGKAVKKNLQEVLALAQTTVAADNRLDEAKRLLNEARERSQAPEHPPATTRTPDKPDPSQAAPKSEHPPIEGLDPAKLGDIVERIQVGDKDDGAQALSELVTLVNANKPQAEQVTPEQIGEVVRQHFIQRETQTEIDSALNDFASKYSQVANDADYRSIALDRLDREMREDLKKIGLSDSDLAPIGSNLKGLATLHRQARINGLPVRTYSEVLKGVGDYVTHKFKLDPPTEENPQPQPRHQQQQQRTTPTVTAQDRAAQKRAAPQQPRTAGGRRPAPPPPRPKTTQEIVAEQRRARGFN